MEIGGYILSIISYIPLRMNQYGIVQKGSSVDVNSNVATRVVAIL